MMVTFVSQCEKNALKKTRRVLDAFADRIGSNTWQTVITEDGLKTARKMLRKTATKNTAVSCHWIRSRSRSQFLWAVGNKEKFNSNGHVPVNATKNPFRNNEFENNWQYLPLIKGLVAISALLHDWGKASVLFQHKLEPKNKVGFKGDPIRHEWISCLLLDALIKSAHKEGDKLTDEAWLTALAEGRWDEDQLKQTASKQTGKPLSNLPMLAKLVAWLIVSHHRLPLPRDKDYIEVARTQPALELEDVLKKITQSWGYENQQDREEYEARVSQCFEFSQGLLSDSTGWKKQLKRWAGKLLACENQARTVIDNGCIRWVLNHSRLCLMLGDHYYSSKQTDPGWKSETRLFANSDRKTKQLNQKLDEHLVGVAKNALNIAQHLPLFEHTLPKADDVQSLNKLSPKAYRWQDKAAEKITQWREQNSKKHQFGFFAVNMASTGCGKTFANAKVMKSLSEDGNSLRYVLALGLRTLTLQTGDEYRDRVELDDSELAVVIGSKAVMELHRRANKNDKQASWEDCGSESCESLLDEEIDWDRVISEDKLSTVLKGDKEKSFLYAPVLSCTIDHLIAATETKRGGKYILPTLRLMSSDLVIDEIDDFSGEDLIAIGRLIHLAGMLGRKVMISSATITPDMAKGYFETYRKGWEIFSNVKEISHEVGCAWIDEFNTVVHGVQAKDTKGAVIDYGKQHQVFINKRINQLEKQPVKRRAKIKECNDIFDKYPDQPNDERVVEGKQTSYFNHILEASLNLHQSHNTTDAKTQIAVSFGVVRVANIQPCVKMTRKLLSVDLPKDTEIRVMAYHSNQVLLMRHKQEAHLDEVLKRKEKEGEKPKALDNPIIRNHLDDLASQGKKHLVFILVATPVEEVGRDHDFDWAVIEPSSFRSIIQMAGRVRRHRKESIEDENIHIMQYNWKGVKFNHNEDKKVFCYPGFEVDDLLQTHDMCKLVNEQSLKNGINAIPRISRAKELKIKSSLVDLEHGVMHRCLGRYSATETDPASLRGYVIGKWYLTAVPQQLARFRKKNDGSDDKKIFLMSEDNPHYFEFCEKNDRGEFVARESLLEIQRISLTQEEMQRIWFKRDYISSVHEMANEPEKSVRDIASRYGELSFSYFEKATYEYNDQLGLVKV